MKKPPIIRYNPENWLVVREDEWRKYNNSLDEAIFAHEGLLSVDNAEVKNRHSRRLEEEFKRECMVCHKSEHFNQ